MGLFDVFKKTANNTSSSSTSKIDLSPMVSQETIDAVCSEIDNLWKDRAGLENTYNSWAKNFHGGVGMRFESLKKSAEFRQVLSMSYDSAREHIFGIGGNGHFWEKFGEGQQIERINYRISYIFYNNNYNVGSTKIDDLFESLSQMDYEDAAKWSRMPVSGYALEAQRQIENMTKALYQEAGVAFYNTSYTEDLVQNKLEAETFNNPSTNISSVSFEHIEDKKNVDPFADYCIEAAKRLKSSNVPYDGGYEANDPVIKGGYYLLEAKPTETEEDNVKEVVYHCHYTLSSEGQLVIYEFECYTNKQTYDVTLPYRPEVKAVSANQLGGQALVQEMIEKRMKLAGIFRPEKREVLVDREVEINQDNSKKNVNNTVSQTLTHNKAEKSKSDINANTNSKSTINIPEINRIKDNSVREEEVKQVQKVEMSDEVMLLKGKAEAGDPEAQYQLAFHYNIGKGVKQDKSEAFRWYNMASDNGNLDAMCIVASAYLRGEMGCKKDVQKSFDLYEIAESKGSKTGTRGLGYVGLELGNMFYTGEDVEQDYIKALQWYEYGAKKGNADAQCSIAIMYENGDGVKQGIYTALQWYQKASDNGDKEAKERIEYYRRMVNK